MAIEIVDVIFNSYVKLPEGMMYSRDEHCTLEISRNDLKFGGPIF